MNRRHFLTLLSSTLAGCALWRADPYHVFLRSEYIDSEEKLNAVVSRAKLETTEDGRYRVLYTSGTPYERGFQQGYLLRKEVQNNIGYLYDQAVNKFKVEELFDEVYERMRPYIPPEYIEEMHGLAHGSKLPLRVVHGVHILPEIGEWGGKKQVGKIVKKMLRGELGTSCSNLCARHGATVDGKPYVVRILDWGLHRISHLHQYPLLTVARPDKGIPYVNIGWVGFLGAVSGMNAQGITLGEMGYGDPEGETLHGMPMPFLLRKVLSEASNLSDVRNIISSAPGTCSYVFLMSDGKTGEAQLYVRDKDRFIVFGMNEHIVDKGRELPPIQNMVYGGHYREKMADILQENQGKISPEKLMKEIIPAIAMPSNFQNVIYSPKDLTFWATNARSKKERAAEQPYTFFNFKKALEDYKG